MRVEQSASSVASLYREVKEAQTRAEAARRKQTERAEDPTARFQAEIKAFNRQKDENDRARIETSDRKQALGRTLDVTV